MSLEVSFTERLQSHLTSPIAGMHLCVAFSGGLDSTVLLHLLARCAPRLGFQLSAVHVHHGLSLNADAWVRHCEATASALNIPLEVHRVQVDQNHGDGLEAAARCARHSVFATLKCDWVVLAHHRSDQAETVLHRMMRGTGVHGAAGMRTLDASRRLLRPLLAESRSTLLAWAEANQLIWIEDESNGDARFTRNFLRTEVLPLLQSRHAGVELNLARAAALFEESAQLLDVLAAADIADIACGSSGSRAVLQKMSAARARNLLRYLLVSAGAMPPATERLHEALRQLCEARDGARVLFDDWALCAWRDVFWIEEDTQPLPLRCEWHGEAQLAWGRGAVRFVAGIGPEALRLDSDDLVFISPRKGGESLRLHAGGPSRAFKQMVQEVGVPPWERERLPVLRQGESVVWIGGLGASVEWRCAEGERGWCVEWLTD